MKRMYSKTTKDLESEKEENTSDDILKRLTLIKKLRRQSVSPITRNIRKGKFDAMTFPSNFSFSNVTRIKVPSEITEIPGTAIAIKRS